MSELLSAEVIPPGYTSFIQKVSRVTQGRKEGINVKKSYDSEIRSDLLWMFVCFFKESGMEKGGGAGKLVGWYRRWNVNIHACIEEEEIEKVFCVWFL